MDFSRHLTYLLLLAVFCGGPLDAEPLVPTDLREGDRVEMSGETVTIYSQKGIGQATLRSTEAWPQKLRFRFCYSDGRGFDRMEGLTVETEALQVRGTFRDKTQMPFGFRPKEGSVPAVDGGLLEVDFQKVDGALELKLPPHFASQTKKITVHWVDVYRD